MVGIWSKKTHFAAVFLAPLGDTEQEQGTMRQENILQPTQLSLHILYGSLKPPQKVFFVYFCFFPPFEKQTYMPITLCKWKTEPNRTDVLIILPRSEPNREPKINQVLENETDPNRRQPGEWYKGNIMGMQWKSSGDNDDENDDDNDDDDGCEENFVFFSTLGMEKTRNKNEDNKPKISGYTKHGM